ncbi:MAG: HAMP domain-containing sensor histidine kinase [Longimicrobiaceae bacterium]
MSATRFGSPLQGRGVRYGAAVLTSVLAVTGTVALQPVLPRLTLLLALTAVVVSAWYGGFGPGLLAAALGAFGLAFYVLPQGGAIKSTSLADAVYLTAFLAVSTLVSALAEALRGSVRRSGQQAAALRARTSELESALAALEEASHAKSEFLANMSHELRTPVNAVIGYTELIGMGIAGPVSEAQKGQLDRITSNSRHLLGLINEILDLAKVEAGQMHVAREPGRVGDAVSAALELVEPLATQAELELANLCRREADWHFIGDDDRVRQILVNLLSNAVKFTGPGGRITVTCGLTSAADPGTQLAGAGPWAYVRVEDTGEGIAPEQLEAVFEPFVQAERGWTRTRGGTGLGLTISRQLARLMEGDLSVRSRLGEGSCFTLWLPAAGAADAQAASPVPLPFPAPGPQPRGLGRVGEVVQAEADAVVPACVRRLRGDPLLPDTESLTDAQLEDHTLAFVAAVAQALIILEETGGEPELMRDGSDIQQLISERHGARRARLGWTEAALRREFAVLREEVEAAVRRGVPADEAVDVEGSLAVFTRFVLRAEHVSVRGFRLAAAVRMLEPVRTSPGEEVG